MRFNLKAAWFSLCGLVFFIILSLWNRCGFLSFEWEKGRRSLKPYRVTDQIGESQFTEIDCDINNEYTVSCRKESDEVFIPFTFLHSYFEVCYFHTKTF